MSQGSNAERTEGADSAEGNRSTMTRHGSLAYYLAAWVCGCFFAAGAIWLDIHVLRISSMQDVFNQVGFLAFYFFGLILGAVPSLLFAWGMRRLLKPFPASGVYVWAAAGGGLALLLVWLLSGVAHLARDPRYLPYSALPFWPFLIVGPAYLAEGNIWLTLPVGAATAAVLFAVQRAFTQPPPSTN
jgi:hypothetical protein